MSEIREQLLAPAVWRRDTADGFTLRVHVQPGARTTELCGEYNGALKIRLAAPPVDGKANAALCRFLADALGVPVRDVTIERGQGTREKVVKVRGVRGEKNQCRRKLLDTAIASSLAHAEE